MKKLPIRPRIAFAVASIVFSYGVGAVAQEPPDDAAPEDSAEAVDEEMVDEEAADEEEEEATETESDEGLPAEPKKGSEGAVPAEGSASAPAATLSAQQNAEAAPTAGVAAEADAADAQAAAIEAELLGGGESGASDTLDELTSDELKLRIYGFADFTYNRLFSDRTEFNALTYGYPSFYVGNLNVYLDSKFGSQWRALSEVRFTYLPDGGGVQDLTTGVTTRTASTYTDYTDFDRNVDVGGVIIERAWIEYAAHPLFTARAGQFLTPYGIWNVDHGTPVIVGTRRPFIVGNEYLPARQTGLQVYGTYGVESTQVGYHLTLSNGRGPVDQYRDYDKNKAVGWRIWAQQDTGFGTFVLGTSGYKGTYTDKTQTLVQDNSVDPPRFAQDYTLVSEYKELSLAADFKWTWKGAMIVGEFINHDVGYMDDTRPAAVVFGAGPQGFSPDRREWGGYWTGGYRFDFLGIMPYYGGEYIDQGPTSFAPTVIAHWIGLNVRPTPHVVFKVQGTRASFIDEFPGLTKPEPLKLLTAQIAWSF